MSTRQSPRRPVRLAVAALAVVPVVEIVLLVVVGQWIGLWPTLAIIAAGIVAGVWVTRRAGRRAWQALAQTARDGKGLEAEPSGAAMTGLGGALLIVPGYLTDLVALVVLLPLTRPWARRLMRRAWDGWVQRLLGVTPELLRIRMDPDNTVPGSVVQHEPARTPSEHDTGEPVVIKGEVER